MADFETSDQPTPFNRTRFISFLVDAGGWAVSLAAVAWALARFWVLSRGGGVELYGVVATVAVLLAGLGSAALLWGVAEMVRRVDGLQQSLERGSESPAPPAGGAPVRAAESTPTETARRLDDLVGLMREVRDISLLSDEQRRLRVEAQGRAMLAELQREVPVLLREHNWIEARSRVQEARERFPMFRELDALEQQIELMRNQVEAHDIEAAERQVRDLTALGAWERVAEVMEELLERHPGSERTQALAREVRARRHLAEAEQRARLMAKAQEAVNARDWRTALDTALVVIQRYPRSPEAQALRLQLPTLRENTEIKERQQLEAQFRDLVQMHRYDEALRVARTVVDQYPNSKQAAILREQLPRLEERVALGQRI